MARGKQGVIRHGTGEEQTLIGAKRPQHLQGECTWVFEHLGGLWVDEVHGKHNVVDRHVCVEFTIDLQRRQRASANP